VNDLILIVGIGLRSFSLSGLMLLKFVWDYADFGIVFLFIFGIGARFSSSED
jgi:hypothetical protein